MKLPHGVRRTFRLLVPGGYRDEVDEEIRFHLECRIDELVAEGMDPAEARREARRRFGDPDRVVRECRSIARTMETGERRATLRDELVQDLGWALRQLRRQPTLTLVSVMILALGIGAATALFGVADAVVFRPLPFEAPDRLVWIGETTPQGERFSVSLPNLLDWRRETRAFSALAGGDLRNGSLVMPGGSGSDAGSGAPQRVKEARVTEDFFEVLGLRPALGGPLPAEAFVPGGDRLRVVLSDELWRRDFGADPEVVGSTVMLEGEPHRIAGVVEPGAVYPQGAELWTPLVEGPRWDRGEKDFSVVARLAPGVSIEQAGDDLDRVAAELAERYPAPNRGWGAEVIPLREATVGPEVDRALLVLLGAVGLLLLIACVNVSSLLVARGAARGGEMAVRVSLGASRARLVRQLLAESAAIGALGGAVGLLLAWSAVELLRRFGPAEVPRLSEAAVDGRVLLFAVLVALASSLAAGLLPALRSARPDPGAALGSGFRAGGRSARLRGALVVTQLALAVTLLIGAGLTARSYLRLLQVDPGFDAADVLAVRVDLPEAQYGWEERPTVVEEVRRRLAALPGVASVGASVGSPFAGFYTANSVALPGQEPDADGGYPMVQWRAVTPGYFEALDVGLLRGRVIDESDGPEGDAIVVSRSVAERFWPGEDALGQRLLFGGGDGNPRTVVGVVDDVRDTSLDEAAEPTIFLPYAQIPWVHQTWMVEVAGGPEVLTGTARAVRQELRRMLPDVPVPELHPLSADIAGARTHPRFQALLMLAFAVTAGALAAGGVYGLMAFSVARREREIGVRMALGARPRAVVAMVIREGARLVIAGALLGTAGAVALARALESLLYETPALEPATYGVAVGVLAAAALFASWLPARRAATIDPKRALAAE